MPERLILRDEMAREIDLPFLDLLLDPLVKLRW